MFAQLDTTQTPSFVGFYCFIQEQVLVPIRGFLISRTTRWRLANRAVDVWLDGSSGEVAHLQLSSNTAAELVYYGACGTRDIVGDIEVYRTVS